MAKRKTGEESEKLFRTEKFEVKPTPEDMTVMLAVSVLLQQLFNSALTERVERFNTFMVPLYARFKTAEGEEVAVIRAELRQVYAEHSITLFDQINALTARRSNDPEFAAVTRNWQEETLDSLDGAFKSFVALRKRGDYDARPPRERRSGFFQKIPGRSGFKLTEEGITLSCGGGRKLQFPIPAYQRGKLALAAKLKKFELYRDEHDLSKPGRFWLSVSYELPKPQETAATPESTVYLSLGASSLGILSSRGEEVLPLWRADKHWSLKIEIVEKRMKKRVKGSRGWRALNMARRRMQHLSSRQNLQDEREVARYILERHGTHVIVSELVVRSKEGKLADSEKPGRQGRLGLNWAAQNTGSLARLVALLEEKAKEYGGSVRKHKLVLAEYPPGTGAANKLWMVEKLKESFLATHPVY